MSEIKYSSESAKYFSVLSDGKFHHSVSEGTPNAVKREYETKEGVKGFKWELQAESITGVVDHISILDGEYGKQMQVYFKNDENNKEVVVISFNLNSNFAEDLLQKLPNVKLNEKVTLSPYSFEDEKGKNRKGITVHQDSNKIINYYKKSEKKGDKTVMTTTNGYPEIPKEAFSKTKPWGSDDWKIYFMQARKFLVGELEKNTIYKDSKNVSDKQTEDIEINWDTIGTQK